MTVKQVFNTSADLDYPNVLPTLDLDFANNKTLDPRITFARSSGGSYVGPDGLIKYAGVNEARFDHNPITGESLGLLIEESRTNLVPQSTSGANCTVTIDSSVVAPDGSSTAYKIVPTVNSGNAYSSTNFTTNTSGSTQTYCWSVFVKQSSKQTNVVFIQFGGTNTANVAYNFDTDTFTPGSTTNSGRILYPNGWVRLYAYTSMTNGEAFNLITIIGTVENYGGTSASLYKWGEQIELGNFPTSFIATNTTSTKTRAEDSSRIVGKNFNSFYNPTEGTILCNARLLKVNTPAGKLFWSVGEELNFPKSIYMVIEGNLTVISSNLFNTTNQAQFILGPTSDNSFNRTSYAYKENDAASAFNGSNYQSDNSCRIPTFSPGNFAIGNVSWGLGAGTSLNGTISRLTYYPKRLPQSQLLSLTA
jgi:hypothetical protein